MPSGRTAQPNITDNKDGTVTVKYSPTERGLHEMDIKYDGNHIPGDPSSVNICSVSEAHILSSSAVLSANILSTFNVKIILSVTGSPLQFYVDAINSGHVTAYGPGLSHGTMNRPATFTIVTKDAGEGIPHMYTRRYKSPVLLGHIDCVYGCIFYLKCEMCI